MKQSMQSKNDGLHHGVCQLTQEVFRKPLKKPHDFNRSHSLVPFGSWADTCHRPTHNVPGKFRNPRFSPTSLKKLHIQLSQGGELLVNRCAAHKTWQIYLRLNDAYNGRTCEAFHHSQVHVVKEVTCKEIHWLSIIQIQSFKYGRGLYPRQNLEHGRLPCWLFGHILIRVG